MSTAFLRMMEARKDFTIFNEPSQAAFETAYFYDMAADWYQQNAPKNFQEVKKQIFATAQSSPVFIKEISYGVHDFILQDRAFMQDPRITFVFLVRNPHAIAISFYQKINYVPDGYDVLIGTKKLYGLYEIVQKESPNPVTVIFSEDLAKNPEEVSKFLCNKLNIPFLEHALTWDSHEEKGYDQWNEFKTDDSVRAWHDVALKSTHFIPLHIYKTDPNGTPTFSEIENLQDRKKVQNAYEENAPYYEKFVALSLLQKD